MAEPEPIACPVCGGDASDQDWEGMHGLEAFLMIQRHADDWDQIYEMMNAWLRANGGTVPDMVSEVKCYEDGNK